MHTAPPPRQIRCGSFLHSPHLQSAYDEDTADIVQVVLWERDIGIEKASDTPLSDIIRILKFFTNSSLRTRNCIFSYKLPQSVLYQEKIYYTGQPYIIVVLPCFSLGVLNVFYDDQTSRELGLARSIEGFSNKFCSPRVRRLTIKHQGVSSNPEKQEK